MEIFLATLIMQRLSSKCQEPLRAAVAADRHTCVRSTGQAQLTPISFKSSHSNFGITVHGVFAAPKFLIRPIRDSEWPLGVWGELARVVPTSTLMTLFGDRQ